ncbi:proline-rich proteoglycan 2-like [Meriones unguiculatus]|uniref:proline-rich proteoglycan 2-like n=1 Tax=Meriones unguiculatus TaxID=10047 RepID=UPI00293F215E|nr:proline-rich proteoglycan 2-like [Meriones unguiculatus]
MTLLRTSEVQLVTCLCVSQLALSSTAPFSIAPTIPNFFRAPELECAPTVWRRRGLPGDPRRQGQDWAGGAPLRLGGRPRQRTLPPATQASSPGAGRVQAGEPRPGRPERECGRLGTPAGRVRPGRHEGRAGVRLDPRPPSPDRAYPAPRDPSTIAAVATASHKGPGPPCPARRGGGAAGRGQTLHPPSRSPRRPGPPPPPGPQRPPPSRRRQRPPPHGRKQRPPTAGRSPSLRCLKRENPS